MADAVPPMASFGMTLMLRDDPAGIEEYKRCHRAVWPSVKARLREVGISRMRIFLHGAGGRRWSWCSTSTGRTRRPADE